jgi:cytochrome c-type biogenesis protein CcmH/NrfF
MVNIKIKLLLKAIDGTISFIEFIQDGKSKILAYDTFVARFGDEVIKDLK